MARFGRDLVRSLTQPSFTQGLLQPGEIDFTGGMNVPGLGGMSSYLNPGDPFGNLSPMSTGANADKKALRDFKRRIKRGQ